VRYVDPSIDRNEPGFFSKLFGNAAKPITAQKFRIAVKASGETTRVSVMNSQGEAETSDNAQRILKVLADDLK
jgi:outer membrane protein assembly factor BamC